MINSINPVAKAFIMRLLSGSTLFEEKIANLFSSMFVTGNTDDGTMIGKCK